MWKGRTGTCWWVIAIGDVSPSEHAGFVQNLRAWGQDADAATLLCIAHDAPAPSPLQRSEIAAELARFDARRMAKRGFAVVTDSILMRGAVTAITWLAPPAFELQAFAKPEPAVAWLARVDRALDAELLLARIYEAAPPLRGLPRG